MPSSHEKVSLSLSETPGAYSTFDFLADEFEVEAWTRENLDELAWKLYERYMAAHDEDFEPRLSFTEEVPCRGGLLLATNKPVYFDRDEAVMSRSIDNAVCKAVRCACFAVDETLVNEAMTQMAVCA